MRKPAITLGAALIVIVAAAVAVAPYLIDWRGAIGLWFHRASGGELRIAGPVAWHWLPEPELRAADATVSDGGGPSLTAAAIVLYPTLSTLWHGTVASDAVTLIGPSLRLTSGVAVPADINRLRIEDGTIACPGIAGGAGLRLDHVDMTLVRDAAPGAWRLSGGADWRGQRIAVDGSAGAPAGAALPLDFSLQTPASGALLRFSGTLDRAAARVTGRLTVTAPSLAAAADPVAARLSLPAAPVALSAQLAATADTARLESLTASLGDLRLDGAAQIALAPAPRFALSLETPLLRQKDIDGLAAAWRTMRTAPLPAGWQGQIALKVGAATWRAVAIEQLQARAAIASGRVSVQQLSALLPGGSTLQARADLRLDRDAQATGEVTLTSDDSRELLELAGLPTAAVPADRLRHAAISAPFSIRRGRIALTGIAADIDDSRLTGDVRIALATQPGPDVAVRLAIDRLNLDAYLPLLAGDAEKPLAVLARAPAIDLDADIAMAIVGGSPVRHVQLSVSGGNGGGIATLTTGAGVLPGIDLPRLEDTLKAAPRPRPGGTTPFSSLRADFAIIGRHAHSEDARMTLADGAAQGSLDLDLASGMLSGRGAIHLAAPKGAPPIPLSLSGPLAAPAWSFDLTPLTAVTAKPP